MASGPTGSVCPSLGLEYWLCASSLICPSSSGVQNPGLASGGVGGFCLFFCELTLSLRFRILAYPLMGYCFYQRCGLEHGDNK